jgi:hypothetical protein
MRTLSLMMEEEDGSQLPQLLEDLFPVILPSVHAGAVKSTPLRLTLSIVSSCVKTMPVMEFAARKQLRAEQGPRRRPLCGAEPGACR